MNAAHLHLVLVHIPIVIAPVATVLLCWGLLKKQPAIRSVAYSLVIVSALSAALAFQFGEGAEELVEDMPGIREAAIEEHEEASDIALWVTIASGIGALGGLIVTRLRPDQERLLSRIGIAVAIVASCSAGSLAYAGYQGGKIRHPEAYAPAPAGQAEDND